METSPLRWMLTVNVSLRSSCTLVVGVRPITTGSPRKWRQCKRMLHTSWHVRTRLLSFIASDGVLSSPLQLFLQVYLRRSRQTQIVFLSGAVRTDKEPEARIWLRNPVHVCTQMPTCVYLNAIVHRPAPQSLNTAAKRQLWQCHKSQLVTGIDLPQTKLSSVPHLMSTIKILSICLFILTLFTSFFFVLSCNLLYPVHIE